MSVYHESFMRLMAENFWRIAKNGNFDIVQKWGYIETVKPISATTRDILV